jgi:two-component system, LytTR family, response regulator
MGQLSVIIADNHSHSMEIIAKYTNQFPGITIIDYAYDSEELVSKTIIQKPDIVIVDISMPNNNGFAAIEECLQEHPTLKVIFVTANKEYAVSAFDIGAIDYIIKPVKINRLFRALEEAKHVINEHLIPNRTGNFKRLYVRQGANHHYIPKEEILYFEKSQYKVLIHTSHEIFETHETLDYYMDKLDSYFYRSHRSFIINLTMLVSIKPSGNTFLAYFQHYDTPAFIAKAQLNTIKHQMDYYQ